MKKSNKSGKRGRRILAAVVSAVLAFTVFQGVPVFAATTVNVSTGAEFNAAIKGKDSPITINVLADIDGVSSGTLGSSQTFTVNGNGHTVRLASGNSYLAKLNSSSTITVKNLTVDGTGAAGTLSYGGGAIVARSGNVTLENVVIKNCTAGGSGGGGAVSIQSSSYTIKATNCSFINNKAASSSGIGGALKGKVDLVNSTFYGNEARDDGGAVYTSAAGTITNCTFVNNKSGASGGGIRNNSSSASSQSQIKNNIIIGNTAASDGDGHDVYRANDQGYNLIGTAVNLTNPNAATKTGITNNGWLETGAPKDNGGNALPTIALIPTENNPAINKGTATGAPLTDQRGFTRIGLPDIGAYEFAKVEASARIKKGEILDLSSVSPLAKGLFETVDVTVNGEVKSAAEQSLIVFDSANNERVKGIEAGTLTVNGYVGGIRFIEVEVTVEDEDYPDKVNSLSIGELPAEVGSDMDFEAEYTIETEGDASAAITPEFTLADGSPLPSNIKVGDIKSLGEGRLGLVLANEPDTNGEWHDYELRLNLRSDFDFTVTDSKEFLLKKPADDAVVGVTLSASPRELKSEQNTVLSYAVLSPTGVPSDAKLRWSIDASQGIAVRGLADEDMTSNSSGSIALEVKNRSASSGTIKIEAVSSSNPYRTATVTLTVQGTSKEVRSYDELYQALLAAEDGDVISLKADLTAKKVVRIDGTSSASINAASKSLQSAIALKKNVIIDGGGHSIDGGGYYAIFYGTGGTASIKNLTITNAVNTNTSSSEKQGVAIALKGGNVNLENVTIYGCSTGVGYGGALYLHEGSRSNLKNCTLVNNKAKRGGGIYADNATVTIENTIIYANRADDYGDNLCYTGSTQGLSQMDAGHNIIYDIFYYASSSSSRTDVTDTFPYAADGETQNKNTLDVYGHEWLASSLGNNGGGAKTLALLKAKNSPAIDKVPLQKAPELDERGIVRTGLADIGAYEYYSISGIYNLAVGEKIFVDDDYSEDENAKLIIDAVSRWTTDSRSIATMDSGHITGHRPGHTMVKGFDASGSEVATFDVYVGDNIISEMNLTASKTQPASGEQFSLSYAVSGSAGADTGIIWTARRFEADAWDQYSELPEGVSVQGLPGQTSAKTGTLPITVLNFTDAPVAISLTAVSAADESKKAEVIITVAPTDIDGITSATIVNIEQLRSKSSFDSGEEIEVFFALPETLKDGDNYPFNWSFALCPPDDHDAEYPLNDDMSVILDTGSSAAATNTQTGKLKITPSNASVDTALTLILKGASAATDAEGNPLETAGYHFNISPSIPTVPDLEPDPEPEPEPDPEPEPEPDPNPEPEPVAVADIAGVPTSGKVGVPIILSGKVSPADAAKKTIVWTVKNPGTTGATLSGNRLSVASPGVAWLTATVVGGGPKGANFVKDFAVRFVLPDGWDKRVPGLWRYIQSGEAVKGLVKVNGAWYCFGQDGIMRTGWQKVKGSDGKSYWRYFGTATNDGKMRTGWQRIRQDDGIAYWFYFGSASDGRMKTGWQKIRQSDGKTYSYYFGSSENDGRMKIGWQKIRKAGGKSYWYYFGSSINDGRMKSGWQRIRQDDGIAYWYYFGSTSDGRMKTGWQKIQSGKKVYRFYFGASANDGRLRTGWQTIAGKRYYFGGSGDGKMRTGKTKIDGKYYTFTAKGVLRK